MADTSNGTPATVSSGLNAPAGKASKHSSYAILIAITAAVGGLLFGYDTSVISGAILFVRQQFHFTTFQTEVAVSVVLAGALVGAASGGYLGDRFGRKPCLALTAVIFAVFAVATGLATGFWTFLVARFLVGLAVGVTSMITPLYIAEIAPADIRGALVTLNQLAITTGIAVAYFVDYLLANSGNWPAMFISAVAPSIVLLLALVFLPESPRWLAGRGRFEAAGTVLERVQGTEEAGRSLCELREVLQADQLKFSDLFLPRFRRAVLAGVGLAIFQQITGVNTILYYTPTILQAAGYKTASAAILGTVLIGTVNVAFTVGSLFMLDRVGRRPLLLLSIAAMGISLTHLGYSFGLPHVSRVGIMMDLLVYLAAFAIGLGPVFWLLISEIYPTTVRGQAMSLASVTIWACDLLVTLTFLTLLDLLGPRGSFWLYAAICGAALLFAIRFIPETKGKTLEEIEASW
jgi:sugar porter (SP) family MFS transporter